jgi:hypothetical protein
MLQIAKCASVDGDESIFDFKAHLLLAKLNNAIIITSRKAIKSERWMRDGLVQLSVKQNTLTFLRLHQSDGP